MHYRICFLPIYLTLGKILRVSLLLLDTHSLDEQLKWEEHNSKQCKTISAGIGMLRRAGDFATQVVLITMYNSLVFPHFTYCSTVWHGFRADHINKLYKLQKRAARVT